MVPVQITPQASLDIAKLAQGASRAEVALAALQDSELTPNQVRRLEALLNKAGAASATTSPAGGRIENIDGHQAVVGQISVNGQLLDTMLSEGSFQMARRYQDAYAEELGYRMATRQENRAYAEDLLAKEGDKTINEAEIIALNTYVRRYVRDSEGGVDVGGRCIRDYSQTWFLSADPGHGALFVRASAESK